MQDLGYLKLYKVIRTDKCKKGDIMSFIMCCYCSDQARKTHPMGTFMKYENELKMWYKVLESGSFYFPETNREKSGWIYGKDIDTLSVEYIGCPSPHVDYGIL
jgi:hypothetical protein